MLNRLSLVMLLTVCPVLGTGTLVQQPHGEHTGTDAQRDETAPWVRMAVNAETPVQQKAEKSWAGLAAGLHTYWFEYVAGLKEVGIGTCVVSEGSDCDVTTYPIIPTLQKAGCPSGFSLGWCWTGAVNVTDGNEIKVVARYTQTYPGYGATIGGKSGTIVHVANSAASGAGSLQAVVTAACQANSPHYIVFDVAPTIDLPNSGFRICGRNLTLDGFTAPAAPKLTTASMHLNCLDPVNNITGRGLNNIIVRNIFVDMEQNMSADPTNPVLFERGTSSTACDIVLGESGSRDAHIVMANVDARNSITNDTFVMGARTITDVTLYETHVYDPAKLGEHWIMLDGYRWTIFRSASTGSACRTPFITYHNEFNPGVGNAPDVSIEIADSVFAMGERPGSVCGTSTGRGGSMDLENNFWYGGSVMGNASPGIDNAYVGVCKETNTANSDSGSETSRWINTTIGAGYCEESPAGCGDACESSGDVYVGKGVVFSSYARAPRVRVMDWRTIANRFPIPHTLPHFDGDLQEMALDVLAHVGSWPRPSGASTNINSAITEINLAELAQRGHADEDAEEFDTAGHFTEVTSPVLSGAVAFASSVGDDAVLYSGADDGEIYLEARFRKTANPSGAITLIDMRSSGSASLCNLELLSGGTLRVNDGTNTTQVAPTQINALANDTWYWILMHYQKASAGSCTGGGGIDGTCGYCEAAITQFWNYPITGTTGLLTDASLRYVRPTSQSHVASVVFPDESETATFVWDEINACPSWWCSEGGAGVEEGEAPEGAGAVTDLVVQHVDATWTRACYSVADDSPRLLELSTDSDFTPLHPDADSATLGVENLDLNRPTTWTSPDQRRRCVQIGHPFGNRALQNLTPYYLRVGGQASGSTVPFRTKNPPLGNNYPQFLRLAGPAAWSLPEVSMDRADRGTPADSYADPTTGNPVRRSHYHADRAGTSDYSNPCTSASEQGTDWAGEGNACNADAQLVSSSSGNGVLVVEIPTLGISGVIAQLRLRFVGASGGGVIEAAWSWTGSGSPETAWVQSAAFPASAADRCLPNETLVGDAPSCGATGVTLMSLPWGILEEADVEQAAAQLLIRRVSGTVSWDQLLIDVQAYEPVNWYDGGQQVAFQQVLAVDDSGAQGYLAQVRSTSNRGNIHFINRETGGSTFLGVARPTGLVCGTPTLLDYGTTTLGASIGDVYYVGLCGGQYRIIKGTLSGAIGSENAAADADAPYTWSIEEDDVDALFHAWLAGNSPWASECDASWTPSMVGATADGRVMIRWRPLQDRLGCVGVWEEGVGIIAGGPVHRLMGGFAGDHTIAPTSEAGVIDIRGSELNGPGDYQGPYEMSFVSCSESGGDDGCDGGTSLDDCVASTCQTRIQTSSLHADDGEPYSANIPNELQPLEVGHKICEMGCGSTCPGVTTEHWIVVAKHGPGDFTVERSDSYGGSGPKACATPGPLRMLRASTAIEQGRIHGCHLLWDFESNAAREGPLEFVCNDGAGGHKSFFLRWASTSSAQGGYTACAAESEAAEAPGCPDQVGIETQTSIAGTQAPLPANVFQFHPTSAQNVAASPHQRVWLWDGVPFATTAATYSPVSPSNVSDDLWVFTSAQALDPKRWPIFLFAGSKPLREVSSAAQGDATINAWEFCYAYSDGECRSGSSAGEFYAHIPGWTGSTICASGQWVGANSGPESGVCAGTLPTLAHSIVQARADRNGANGEALRRLATPGVAPHFWTTFGVVKVLPGFASDGLRQWLLTAWEPPGVGETAFAIGAPPTPPDNSVRRSEFVHVDVAIAPPASVNGVTVDNVIGYFGYDDADALRCVGNLMANGEWNGRQERCAIGDPADYGGDPFGLETVDGVSGLARQDSMRIRFPLIDGRAAYYRIDYRDVSNNVLASTGTKPVP